MRAPNPCIVFLCLVVTTPLPAKAKTLGNECADAREFVQEFYDWYISIPNRKDSTAWKIAKRERGAVFTKQLTQALDKDTAAQIKKPGELVGLDFDPFVASQDPEDHYKIGKVLKKGAGCWVEVHGVRQGRALRDQPDVLPELVFHRKQWRFANFHYPDGDDLLAILRRLRAEREKSK